jgi:UDP-glucose 4-epimerase
MKKLVVLGSNSFIAENFINHLSEKNVSIYCFSRSNNESRVHENETIKYYNLDLINISPELFSHLSDADFVFNFVSNSNYLNLLENSYDDLRCVILPVLQIMDYISKFNPNCHYFYFGSRLQYSPGNNLNEDSVRSPGHPYAIHKQLIEYYCKFYESRYSFRYTFLIISNPFGFYSKDFSKNYSFINLMLDEVLSDRNIKIFGDGLQTRDVIFVKDIVEILDILMFSNSKIYGTLNIGSGFSYSIREIAESIIKVTGMGKIEYHEWPVDRKSVETGSYSYDITKLINLIGNYKFHSLEEGIQIIIDKKAP